MPFPTVVPLLLRFPRSMLSIAALLISGGGLSSLEGQQPLSAETDPMREMVERLLDGYRSADPARLAQLYTDDATVLTGRGRIPPGAVDQAVRSHFRNLVGQTFQLDERGSRMLSSDLALAWMIGRTEGMDSTGTAIFQGRVVISLIWRRVDGGWKIAFAQEDLVRSR